MSLYFSKSQNVPGLNYSRSSIPDFQCGLSPPYIFHCSWLMKLRNERLTRWSPNAAAATVAFLSKAHRVSSEGWAEVLVDLFGNSSMWRPESQLVCLHECERANWATTAVSKPATFTLTTLYFISRTLKCQLYNQNGNTYLFVLMQKYFL